MRSLILALCLITTPAQAQCVKETLINLRYTGPALADTEIDAFTRSRQAPECSATKAMLAREKAIQIDGNNFVVHVMCTPCVIAERAPAWFADYIRRERSRAKVIMRENIERHGLGKANRH